ncbi:hypothetical protein IV57_GL000360 [Companilactobacillus kimchiensis]|uniref:Uncharacterized protein n=2 Tax=Companilactobacillus kimchiensis TaxID=993692 RepID=A0A0R2LBU3_9LACO|nr:hypothetical protein IV57_GL000360 [Companilactobacillus kimchiensis]
MNDDWLFHYGELQQQPRKISKKALALGGYTAPLPNELGSRLPISEGGRNFLKLIAGGNETNGLKALTDTDLTSKLDDSWKKIDIPHDWQRDEPYVEDVNKAMTGSKPDSIGYYRKTFQLPKDDSDIFKTVINFEGVMGITDLWFNGAYLGRHNSGYSAFSYDISEMAHYGSEGTNVILLKVDKTSGSEGWWYEGAGLYRTVWLEQEASISLNRASAYIYTKKLTTSYAELGLECMVENNSENTQIIAPKIILDGQTMIQFEPQSINSLSSYTFKKSIKVTSPKLWSPENPQMYQAAFIIPNDEIDKKFGIRTFEYTTEGFFLNGTKYQLRGVCEHQDFAGVGIALNQDIVDYKVKLMKKMGVNAWRSTHHFASPELLQACDKYGVILINENRLLESTPWRINDLERAVKASRMHPSLAFWSIANEELSGNTAVGSRIAAKLVRTIKKYDFEHLIISAELLTPSGELNADYLENLDVLGVNYPEAEVMGPSAKRIKQRYPDLPMMSTENASYFSTRGVYQDNLEKSQCNNLGSYFSMVLPGIRKKGDPGLGGTAHPERTLQYMKENPYMGGVFLWTAFDYYGEPAPFGWPAISSQFGIADLCGFPKDYYYYYQANWTNKPMVHVMPSWNKKQIEIDDKGMTNVRAFSNAAELELFINHQSFGKQLVKDGQVNWHVQYQSGSLVVKAYQNNQEVASDSQYSNMELKNITCDKLFEGTTTNLYKISAFDDNDHLLSSANNEIKIQVENGRIIGVGNGNPIDHSLSGKTSVKLFNGLAMIIVSKTNESEPDINLKLIKF